MSVVYDAGVLVAADRRDRRVWADHRVRLEAGVPPSTTAPVVAQVSRSARRVTLHRFLRGCRILAFWPEQGHEVGALLARAGTSDVVDGHVAVTAEASNSTVVTADVVDFGQLSANLASGLRIKPR